MNIDCDLEPVEAFLSDKESDMSKLNVINTINKFSGKIAEGDLALFSNIGHGLGKRYCSFTR